MRNITPVTGYRVYVLRRPHKPFVRYCRTLKEAIKTRDALEAAHPKHKPWQTGKELPCHPQR